MQKNIYLKMNWNLKQFELREVYNISMNYFLEDKNGQYILDFTISPDEYK